MSRSHFGQKLKKRHPTFKQGSKTPPFSKSEIQDTPKALITHKVLNFMVFIHQTSTTKKKSGTNLDLASYNNKSEMFNPYNGP